MRRLCEQLRSAAGEPTPPYGIERRVLPALRADIEHFDRPGIDARLTCQRGRYVIHLNEGMQWHHRRWVVAHEVAHMLLLDRLADDHAALRALKQPEHLQRVEALCHRGAGEYLVPTADLRQRLSLMRWTPEDLQHLSDRYLVSWPALALRIAQSLPGATVTLWRHRGRPADGEHVFRIARTYGSRWLPAELSNRFLSVDIVATAHGHGDARAADLTVGIRARSQPTLALAARAGDPCLPGRHVRSSYAVATLLLDRSQTRLYARLCTDPQMQLAM